MARILTEFSNLLLILATLGVDASRFERVRLATSTVLSSPTTVRSDIECALKCVAEGNCFGYVFTSPNQCQHVSSYNYQLSDNNEGLIGYVIHVPPNIDTLLARGKPTSASTVLSGQYATSNAVDGIYEPPSNQPLSSVAITTLSVNPWWRVNLEAVYKVFAVNILNKSLDPTGWTRTKNAYVTVALNETDIFHNDHNVCGYHDGTLDKYYTLVTCTTPLDGQLVQIQIKTHNYLNLYEVEVHGAQ